MLHASQLTSPLCHLIQFCLMQVHAIVRLNKAMYDAARFTCLGFAHHDLYFPDGSCPSELIRNKFLQIVEADGGELSGIAVPGCCLAWLNVQLIGCVWRLHFSEHRLRQGAAHCAARHFR